MTSKKFFNELTNSKNDVFQLFIDELERLKIDYCVIDDLAVNAYAEPVASLDLDLVLTISDIEKLLNEITSSKEKFVVTKLTNSINLQHPDSDLRIQIQTDLRYQSFIAKASFKQVLGYVMKVASLEDLLNGKIWAYSDKERRKSKRQKDLADIMRLVETHPHLYNLLPENIKVLLD
jgi:hypothetical protein